MLIDELIDVKKAKGTSNSPNMVPIFYRKGAEIKFPFWPGLVTTVGLIL